MPVPARPARRSLLGPPESRVVSLWARVNNNYVAAENAGTSPLIANRTTIGTSAQFNLIG